MFAFFYALFHYSHLKTFCFNKEYNVTGNYIQIPIKFHTVFESKLKYSSNASV